MDAFDVYDDFLKSKPSFVSEIFCNNVLIAGEVH